VIKNEMRSADCAEVKSEIEKASGCSENCKVPVKTARQLARKVLVKTASGIDVL
jgi:hypothetical protein